MYKNFVAPILDQLDAEGEQLAIRELLNCIEKSPKYSDLIKKLIYREERFSDERLNINKKGILLDNPLIVAAGWDKEAHAVKALYDLGFGGVEIGTVTPKSQTGNAKPRHFWLSSSVALNSYGFNSPGMDVVWQNLQDYKNSNIPIGISMGKNKDITEQDAPQAYASVGEKFYQDGSYFVINVSSPNTPGLRALQGKDSLDNIVTEIIKVMENLGGRKPLFVKIAPDMTLEEIDQVIEVVLENDLTGIIAANTTLDSDLKAKYGEQWRNADGGLSGDDEVYRNMVTDIVKHIFKKTSGKIFIIAAGGIKDAETALEKIRAGANALQIMTALSAEGPHLPGIINRGLVEELEKLGMSNISELVGTDVS